MILHRFIGLILALGLAAAQAAPTERDVAYDDDNPAQALDVYLAKSDKPTPAVLYIHGGGWRGGSKNAIPGFLAKAVEDGWLSVVSVEYRFTDVATHPAQVQDCARAVQFVRQNAEKWNIDPKRIGVTGGSAGGHLSLWLALHDDLAKPGSEDPVERQSSRVSCAVGFAGPTDWALLSSIPHGHPAYRQLLGYEPGTPAEDMDEAKKADVSPITFVSKDDPPIMIVHGDADDVVPVKHALDLDAKLRANGVVSQLVIIAGGNHGVAGGGGAEAADRATAFFKQQLLGGEPKAPAKP